MAVQNIVLYAPRLYASSTYASNEDPESLSLSLTDTTAITDTDFRFFQEALSILDAAITTNGTKALADAMNMTEARLFAATRELVDLVSLDATLLLRQVKGLSEFIRIHDWVEIKLQRAGIWESTPAFGFAPSQIHLYGPGVYYGVDYYGANPSVNWFVTELNSTTWRGADNLVLGESLYSEQLFSQASYGSVPAVNWTKPLSTARQAWTNNNGESHN